MKSVKEKSKQKRSDDEEEYVFRILESDKHVFIGQDDGLFNEAGFCEVGVLAFGARGIEFGVEERLIDCIDGHDIIEIIILFNYVSEIYKA